jgi:hypothetical protein
MESVTISVVTTPVTGGEATDPAGSAALVVLKDRIWNT